MKKISTLILLIVFSLSMASPLLAQKSENINYKENASGWVNHMTQPDGNLYEAKKAGRGGMASLSALLTGPFAGIFLYMATMQLKNQGSLTFVNTNHTVSTSAPSAQPR